VNFYNYAVAEYGWEELVHKDTARWGWLSPAMHNQYDCHQFAAVVVWISGHATYDLDVYRIYESLSANISHLCNPAINTGGGGGF
jgi:hypothetical protein